jgi:hypothetical protein
MKGVCIKKQVCHECVRVCHRVSAILVYGVCEAVHTASKGAHSRCHAAGTSRKQQHQPSALAWSTSSAPARHASPAVYNNEIPDFLLPFIAEHVRSVEQQGLIAHSDSAAQAGTAGEWQRVSTRRPAAERKAARHEDVLTLYSAALRCAHMP